LSSQLPYQARPADLIRLYRVVAQNHSFISPHLFVTSHPPVTSSSTITFAMLPQITLESPLAQAVATVIQPKLVEMGWSDGQESPLIEYIVLMLVNGKTQEQIATELSNDFLGLEEGDTAALEFSRWLFSQVDILNQQINGVAPASTGATTGQLNPTAMEFDSSAPSFAPSSGEANTQDAEMGDASNDSM
jgi:hypothetical protein